MGKFKTAEAALKSARKLFGTGLTVAVFQYPAGHWAACTSNSETYRNLSENDSISAGITARSWSVEYT